MLNAPNPLSVIPNASVNQVLCSSADANGDVRPTGVTFRTIAPWTEMGNAIVDPCQLGIPPTISTRMQGVYLTKIEQADLVEKNIQLLPNRRVITSAHLQGTNKFMARILCRRLPFKAWRHVRPNRCCSRSEAELSTRPLSLLRC